MLPLRKKVEHDGSIVIDDVLRTIGIRPGDVVEIIPAPNRITIKAVTSKSTQGVVKKVAGKWQNRGDLVDDLLRIREDEYDRPGTFME